MGSVQLAEPEGRKIVAHGAPPWVAGESAGQARNGAKERADAWGLPPRSGAEAGPSFSQCWRTGLLSFALRAKPHENRRSQCWRTGLLSFALRAKPHENRRCPRRKEWIAACAACPLKSRKRLRWPPSR